MSQSEEDDQYATLDEVVQAVSNLTRAELLRLRKRARLQIGGTEYTNPDELLDEAIKRTLVAASQIKQSGERGRCWPKHRGVELPAFLSMSMDSIADASRDSNYQKFTDRLEVLAGADGDVCGVLHGAGHSHADAMTQAMELEETGAREAAAKRDVLAIEQLFKDDQAVLAVIEGERDGMSAKEVRDLFGLDETTYDSARRRLRRKVDKLMPGRRAK